jgi:hypothetical protein
MFGKVCDILWVLFTLVSKDREKKDYGYLVLMVSGSKRNPYHFLKALVMGHSVKMLMLHNVQTTNLIVVGKK